MDLLDLIADPWRSGIGRRAFAEVTLLGGFCGALSFWVTSYRLSYSAESLAHGLLPGLVLAALAGVPLLVGAGAGVAVAAGLVGLAGRDDRVGPDTATAVVVSGMFGLGGLLALSPEAPTRLEELLFGDPLGVSGSDLAAAVGLCIVGGACLFALHRPLAAIAFDARGSASTGIPAARARLALLFVLAAALAVAVQGLGSLLVLAVLVAPGVAVRRHSRSPGAAMAVGACVAVLAGVTGLYASYHLGTAAGASVALALCGAAVLGSLRSPWARARRAAGRPRPHPARSSPG